MRNIKFQISNFIRYDGDGSLAAVADVYFGNSELVIHGVKLVHSPKRQALFLAMPSIKRGDSYQDIANIISDELRKSVSLAMYNLYLSKEDEK